MATTRIEAESMTLVGYSAEYSAVSSGNQVIKTDSNGSASTQFSGTPGLYDLKVAYHDENDGWATLSLWVDGQKVDIWSMNAVTDSAIATTGNLRTRTVKGINLKANSVIRIAGSQAGNEFARVDYLDITEANTTSAPTSNPTPTPTNPTPTSNGVTVNNSGITLPPNIAVGIGRVESHDMSRTGYDVEASSISSGGQVVNTSGTGVASTSFSGTAGSYTLKVGYYDENDGQSTLTVKVDGKTVSSWVLNESTNSSIATTGNFRERVLSGVALNTNSVIEIIGTKVGNEFARLDYLEIEAPTTPTTTVEPTPTTTVNSTGVTLPPGIAVGVGRIESDAMTRTGYNVENSSIASGGNVVNAASTGIASAKFSGTTGSYDLKVGYYDENDGQSTLTVKVDGKTVSSWVLNESTNSSIATTGNFRERVLKGVSLNTNSVIEVIGTQQGNEFARLDYLEVAIPGTTTVPTGGVNTFQAEDALLSGVFVDSLNSGAQGGKYADYQNANNDFIEWTVNVAAAGNYDLTWRYANGAANRPLAFTVNGGVVEGNLAFNGTGSWNTWSNKTKTVALKAGNNKIRLRANGSSGANFDYLQVSPGGSVPSSGGGSGKKIRVLALGDSNTRGEGTIGGYRTQFWNRAVNDGVAIDFLGTRNEGPSNLGDKDHQGQGGWSILQMLSWVKAGNLANQNPDMILFMMGTNDANTNGAVSGAAIRDRLSTFIDEVAKVVPKAHLFVSSIMPLDTPRGTAAEAQAARDFNSLIPALVSQKAAQGKRVSFINAGGSLGVGDVNGDNSATNDQNDGLHATAAGYNKLGNAWYNGVSSSNVWQQAVATQSSGASAIESDAVTDLLSPDISGNNVIQSGAGADDLIGGGGADAFVYRNPSEGLDRILDFGGDDVLRVSASGFEGDLVAGAALGSADYVLGSNPTALDGGSTFLYDTSSKTLSFDADGTGSGAATGIATFVNGFTPTASQIEIFA